MTALPSVFPILTKEIDSAEFATPDGAPKHHLPSLDDLITESRARSVDTDLPTYTGNLVAEAIAAGHDHDSCARLVERFARG